MKGKEFYLKCVEESKIPVGVLYYALKNDKSIEVHNSISVHFSTTNNIIMLESIEKIEKTENLNGFMFWMNTTEGFEFLKNIIFTKKQ